MAKDRPDYILIIITGLISVFGLIMLFSASSIVGQERFGDIYYYLTHQILYGMLSGVIAIIAIYFLKPGALKTISLPLIILNIIALALVFVPEIGARYGGSARWINIGPVTFQPSLFLGITVPLYIGALLDKQKIKAKNARFFILAFLILGGIGLLLLKQPATAILAVIGLGFLAMYFCSGAKTLYIVLFVLAGVAGVSAFIFTTPYRSQRIITFFTQSQNDKLNQGYQANQALLAIGAGGIFGEGLGKAKSKSGLLPEQIGDSIIGVIGEELGFVGSFSLIILFLALFWRIFSIANKLRTRSFMYLATIGMGTMLAMQTFINLGANVGLMPVSGLPLPFISYGGTALAINLAQIGLIFSFSKYR